MSNGTQYSTLGKNISKRDGTVQNYKRIKPIYIKYILANRIVPAYINIEQQQIHLKKKIIMCVTIFY